MVAINPTGVTYAKKTLYDANVKLHRSIEVIRMCQTLHHRARFTSLQHLTPTTPFHVYYNKNHNIFADKQDVYQRTESDSASSGLPRSHIIILFLLIMLIRMS